MTYGSPVGGVSIAAPANSDRLISVPFARKSKWLGTVSVVSASDITVTGAPNWAANAFISSGQHYARLLTGVHKGHYFSIAANTASTLTVDSAGLNLSLIGAGDTVEIAPYWTLSSVFPASDAGTSFVASTSPATRQTELLFLDPNYIGINQPAAFTYFFYNGAWRKFGANLSLSFDDTIIYPDVYFIQRNMASATRLISTGRVQPSALGTILVASTAQNDNIVALAHPVDVTLNQSGLMASGFTASTVVYARKDELLWFNPASTGFNNPAVATYFYYNGAWRKFGANLSHDFGDSVTLKAGHGFIVRKAANGTTAPWVFSTGN